jgi:hypothetical protein
MVDLFTIYIFAFVHGIQVLNSYIHLYLDDDEGTFHYMDLQFFVSTESFDIHSFLGHIILFSLDMESRTVSILDPMPIPHNFKL